MFKGIPEATIDFINEYLALDPLELNAVGPTIRATWLSLQPMTVQYIMSKHQEWYSIAKNYITEMKFWHVREPLDISMSSDLFEIDQQDGKTEMQRRISRRLYIDPKIMTNKRDLWSLKLIEGVFHQDEPLGFCREYLLNGMYFEGFIFDRRYGRRIGHYFTRAGKEVTAAEFNVNFKYGGSGGQFILMFDPDRDEYLDLHNHWGIQS